MLRKGVSTRHDGVSMSTGLFFSPPMDLADFIWNRTKQGIHSGNSRGGCCCNDASAFLTFNLSESEVRWATANLLRSIWWQLFFQVLFNTLSTGWGLVQVLFVQAGRLVGAWAGMIDVVKIVLMVVGTAEWRAASMGVENEVGLQWWLFGWLVPWLWSFAVRTIKVNLLTGAKDCLQAAWNFVCATERIVG